MKVRFAPSPTGHLHIGSLRTALFNWLLARNQGGSFLVRIEDTDPERSKQEYTDAIFDALDWIGMEADESPLIQSDREPEHRKIIDRLVQEGKAYRCYCTQEDLVARFAKNENEDFFVRYDGFCLERPEGLREGAPFVVRFKVPDDCMQVTFEDSIRGTITFDREQLDDFIIARSDGRPMYNFVVVADDIHMGITDIVRGEDHISNTPKQLLLYEALRHAPPRFAHLPMILGPSGDRLSKRDGAVSTAEYRRAGYLPDALMCYLVRLGWAHGDQEIFTRKELIAYFSLDQVGKKGAIFDIQKLNWVNSVFIKGSSAEELLTRIVQDVDPGVQQAIDSWSNVRCVQAIEMYKERVSTLKELADYLKVISYGPETYSDKEIAKWVDGKTAEYLRAALRMLKSIETWQVDTLTAGIKDFVKQLDAPFARVAQPIRIALVGASGGPGLGDMLVVVEKEESVKRIEAFIEACSRVM